MNEKEYMLTTILKCDRVDLYTREVDLNESQQRLFRDMVRRRRAGEPLQYILGSWDFYGCKLFVDERVLVPRPETEILVDEVIKRWKHASVERVNILDLGTGSGNIAIALAKNIRNAYVTAVDISKDALALARDNARFNMIASRIQFVCCDMFSFLEDHVSQNTKYDIVVSNPPYVPSVLLNSLPADVRREPLLALDGGNDGLAFYRRLIKDCRNLLNIPGSVYFEMGDGQQEKMEAFFNNYGEYKSLKFINDFTDTPRVVHGQMD